MALIDNSDLVFLQVVRDSEKNGEFDGLGMPMMPPETRLADAGYLKVKANLIRTTLKGKVRVFLLKRFNR
jgi:hypothetical protein